MNKGCSARVLLSVHLALLAPILLAQTTVDHSPGIAWQVKGTWLVQGQGRPLVTGDPILPGSLLQPGDHPANNSIIVLLPDGQSNLYECFTAEDCARGFRVSSLHQSPLPATNEMLARIGAMLLRRNRGLSDAANVHPTIGFPRDEVVVALGQDQHVHVAGLAAKLPNGHYTCTVQPLNPDQPPQAQRALEKSESAIALALPSTGLYVVTIADDMNTPRILLFLAAVSPQEEASINESFLKTKTLLKRWNDDFYGWPVHDFQWAYLESLVLAKTPPAYATTWPASPANSSNVAAEPVFLPPAGALPGDSAIALHSDSPGAAIHYTVDTSQPREESPLYTAPIVIEESGLTIKAFARVPGKKDSPVVTGVFRVRKASPNR